MEDDQDIRRVERKKLSELLHWAFDESTDIPQDGSHPNDDIPQDNQSDEDPTSR